MESPDDPDQTRFSLHDMETALELTFTMILHLKQELDNPTSEVEYYELVLGFHDLFVVKGQFVSGDPVATLLNSYHDSDEDENEDD